MAAPKSGGPVARSISPSSRFHRRPSAHSFASASASASTFAAARSLRSPPSPAPLNLHRYPNPSLSFSMTRPGSPTRSIFVSSRAEKPPAAVPPQKRTCMCSPTNHPGSFRCSLHKGGLKGSSNAQTTSCGSSTRLNMRRSAMKNSLVRIGVEGDWVKRALAALIRPSSHHQRRRGEFRPRPSRLSAVANS